MRRQNAVPAIPFLPPSFLLPHPLLSLWPAQTAAARIAENHGMNLHSIEGEECEHFTIEESNRIKYVVVDHANPLPRFVS